MAQILWDFARQIADGSPGNTTSYYDELCQTFYTRSGIIYTQTGQLNQGQWQDVDYGDELQISDEGYVGFDLHHQFSGIVWGSAYRGGDTLLLLYEYKSEPYDMFKNGKVVLQPDTSIQASELELSDVSATRARDSLYSLFGPGNIVTLFHEDDNNSFDKWREMVVDSTPLNEVKGIVRLIARNRFALNSIKQTFDETVGFNGTRSEVIAAILELAGIENYEIGIDATATALEVDPEDTIYDGLRAFCDQINWFIDCDELGKVYIGPESFIVSHLPVTTHTFDRGADVYGRSDNRDRNDVYTRVCVKREGSSPRVVFGAVDTYNTWQVPQQVTYYRTVHEDMSDADMDDIKDYLVDNLKYRGVSETFTTAFRPEINVGDSCTIQGKPEISGSIIDVQHHFGDAGYFTQFLLVTSGAMSDIATEPSPGSKYVPRLFDRRKTLKRYLDDPDKR